MPLSEGRGHVKGIFFFAPLSSQLRASGTAENLELGLQWDPQQLCNVLIWLMLVWMKRNTATAPSSATCSVIVPLQDSWSWFSFQTAERCQRLFLCSVGYATPTLYMQIHQHKWLATFPESLSWRQCKIMFIDFRAIMRVCNVNRAEAL